METFVINMSFKDKIHFGQISALGQHDVAIEYLGAKNDFHSYTFYGNASSKVVLRQFFRDVWLIDFKHEISDSDLFSIYPELL